jgi:hypothetical protein
MLSQLHRLHGIELWDGFVNELGMMGGETLVTCHDVQVAAEKRMIIKQFRHCICKIIKILS